MKGSSVKRDLLQCQQRPKMPLKQRGMYIETQTGMTPVSTRDRGEKGGGKSSKRPLRSLRRGLNKRERDRGCMTPVSKSGRGAAACFANEATQPPTFVAWFDVRSSLISLWQARSIDSTKVKGTFTRMSESNS